MVEHLHLVPDTHGRFVGECDLCPWTTRFVTRWLPVIRDAYVVHWSSHHEVMR